MVENSETSTLPTQGYASNSRRVEKFLRWSRLGWNDLMYSYRPSIVGPLWQTFSTALWAAGLVVIFGPMHSGETKYIPYLILGVVLWNFISSCITSGARVFLSNAGIILNMPTPNLLHITRLWANLVVRFLFQFVIFLPLIFIFKLTIGIHWLDAIAAFLVLSAIGYSTIILSGLFTTRFRDVEHLFTTAVRFLFFMTPIFWIPVADGSMRSLVATYNPFYHLIEIMRRPLLGQEIHLLHWGVSLSILAFALPLSVYGLRVHGKNVARWL